MKKFLVILFLLVCGFTLTGCKEKNPEVELPENVFLNTEENHLFYKEKPLPNDIEFELTKLIEENELLEITVKTFEVVDTKDTLHNFMQEAVWYEVVINDEYSFIAKYHRYSEVNDTVKVWRWRLYELLKKDRPNPEE